MKTKTTLLLVVVCAVLVGIGWYVAKREKPEPATFPPGAKVFREFPVNRIVKFTITDGKETLTVEKHDTVWVVPSYFNYPADFSKVVNLLKKVYSLKVGQTVRVRAESIGRMKLKSPDDPSAADAEKGTVIQFFIEGDTSVARLIVGVDKKSKETQTAFRYAPPAGQYVRMPDADVSILDEGTRRKENVLLVDATFRLTLNPESWIDTELFNIASKDIREITVTSPKGVGYTLQRKSKDDELSLADLKESEQMKRDIAADVASALSHFRVDKVLPPDVAATNKAMEKPWTYVARTFDGTQYTLNVSDTNWPKAYVQVAVSYEKPEVDSVASNIAAHTSGKSPYEMKEDARILNDMLSSWTYIIGEYKASEMREPRQRLVEPKPAEKEAEAKPANEQAKKQPDKQDLKREKPAKENQDKTRKSSEPK